MTIGRLILALLLLCVALPATAAMPCHDDAMPAAMAMPHQSGTADHQDKATMAHVCIGCVPPSSWRGADFDSPPLAQGSSPIAKPSSLLVGEPSKPRTPPPRIA
jgi:hypothetical protein